MNISDLGDRLERIEQFANECGDTSDMINALVMATCEVATQLGRIADALEAHKHQTADPFRRPE